MQQANSNPKKKRLKEENRRFRTCTDDRLSPEPALVLEVEEREHRGRPRAADLARPGPRRGLGCLRRRRLQHREDKRKGKFNTDWNLRHDQIQSVDRGVWAETRLPAGAGVGAEARG